MDCKATDVMRFGTLRQTKLPNTIATLPCLEEHFINMSDLKVMSPKMSQPLPFDNLNVLINFEFSGDIEGHMRTYKRGFSGSLPRTSKEKR
jgi:hypothetical protein